MTTAVFVKMLEGLQQVTQLKPESQSDALTLVEGTYG
jgi:hypothetical protein